MTAEERKALAKLFAELLKPHAIPPTPLHEVLCEAAKRAGWTRPSAKGRRRQKTAARGRTIQREEDLALRRVLVARFFKQLRPDLRAKPGSTGTVQAIIRQLDALPLDRKPPMTIRTIQEDIRYMRKNGNFGI